MINDRCIGIDMQMIENAIAFNDRPRYELAEEMKDLTGLADPNSVAQTKQWMAENGQETESLDKKAVKELLKNASPDLARVLTLRQQLARSSVKKYQAMQNAVCDDGRARGMFMFYGGSTGALKAMSAENSSPTKTSAARRSGSGCNPTVRSSWRIPSRQSPVTF